MVLPSFLQRALVKVDERFGGVRMTRLSLWAASSALRDRLGLASESALVEACREALANDSAQLELGVCLGLPGEEPAGP